MNSQRKEKRCPLTYQSIFEKERYSREGLKKLSRTMSFLSDLPWSAEEQRREAARRASKISIQGLQPKLSARLSIAKEKGHFEIVDKGGEYILKPQHHVYPELPENEDLSMRLAQMIGIEVPLHGLIYSSDETLTYFIRRFDRAGRHRKLHVEDFAQLSGQDRETKYKFSMERLIPMIEKYCTFPALEKKRLFLRTLFNFLIGNEDMHLKNFSLIITGDGRVALSPAYDFLNTTIVLGVAEEEIALSLNGKKRQLTSSDLIEYYGQHRLTLNEKIIKAILENISNQIVSWMELIRISFLSEEMKARYSEMIQVRRRILNL